MSGTGHGVRVVEAIGREDAAVAEGAKRGVYRYPRPCEGDARCGEPAVHRGDELAVVGDGRRDAILRADDGGAWRGAGPVVLIIPRVEG